MDMGNVLGLVDILNLLTGVRDGDTGKHVVRVAGYVELMLRQMNKLNSTGKEMFSEEYITVAKLAARLHDVGKVGITDLILTKNDRLLEMEFERIKEHTTIGYQILRKGMENESNPAGLNDMLRLASDVAMYHHERWDGKGYPRAVKGKNIPLLARVLAVVDVYDALTSKRVYKEPMTHEQAKEIIIEGSEKQFDPQLVKVFLKIEPLFIKLNKQYEGEGI